MTAPEQSRPADEHTDAVARVICDAEGFVWPDTEHARDVWRVKAHSAMLDALVRAGVLTAGQAKFGALPIRPGDSFSGRAG